MNVIITPKIIAYIDGKPVEIASAGEIIIPESDICCTEKSDVYQINGQAFSDWYFGEIEKQLYQ